jgi:hypothetical protein
MHLNDCQQSGCPGHTLRVEMDCSTDQVLTYVDEEIEHIFDQGYLDALVELYSKAGDDNGGKSKKRGK